MTIEDSPKLALKHMNKYSKAALALALASCRGFPCYDTVVRMMDKIPDLNREDLKRLANPENNDTNN